MSFRTQILPAPKMRDASRAPPVDLPRRLDGDPAAVSRALTDARERATKDPTTEAQTANDTRRRGFPPDRPQYPRVTRQMSRGSRGSAPSRSSGAASFRRGVARESGDTWDGESVIRRQFDDVVSE